MGLPGAQAFSMLGARAGNLLFCLVVLLVIAWVVWQATRWGPRSGLFPLVIGVPILVLAAFQLAVEIRAALRPTQAQSGSGEHDDVPPELVKARSIAIVATVVGFVAAIWLFGFVVAVPLVTFLYLKFAAGERWGISIGLSAAAGVSFYFVFVLGLGVPAPFGVLISYFLD